jgi:hypothetical protein
LEELFHLWQARKWNGFYIRYIREFKEGVDYFTKMGSLYPERDAYRYSIYEQMAKVHAGKMDIGDVVIWDYNDPWDIDFLPLPVYDYDWDYYYWL